MKTLRINALLISLLFLTSCLKDKTSAVGEYDCPNIISYSVDIKPIINTSCVTNQGPNTGCHDEWILNYDNIPGYIQSGLLQQKVFEQKIMPQMPNVFSIDSLTQDEMDLMKCWIQQGYPEN